MPAGTTNGRTFRVRGKGVSRKDGRTGDLLVTVEVAVPQKLSTAAQGGSRELSPPRRRVEDPRAALLDQARES
jgi:molecular chaperone DnaJ